MEQLLTNASAAVGAADAGRKIIVVVGVVGVA